jgi:pyrimidine-nucleoside phosphorylase/thymidine phosphorylase
MSKKIASGADAIVLDVKVGSGAFMKSLDDAKILARTMVDIGKSLKRNTIAILTNMNQPLGTEVGNANEVLEAIKVLRGEGSKDETTVALTIASYMCVLGGAFKDFDSAYEQLTQVIKSGKAIDKFKELITIQGGDSDLVDNPEKLPKSKYHIEVKSRYSGYITELDAEAIGISAMILGAGRKTKIDEIDFSAGITLNKKIGDKVEIGDTLCILHTNKAEFSEAIDRTQNAFVIKDVEPIIEEFIYEVII